MSRIKMNRYLFSITFMSIKQVEYQLENILEAINAELDTFTGKEHIISGGGYLDDNEIIVDGFVETDPEKFFDEYQGDDQPSGDDYIGEKQQFIEVFITFIGTQKGRTQVKKMKKAVDTRLNEFAEKGLIDSYGGSALREFDRTSEFSEEEIQAFQKEHNTRIRRNT